MRQLTIEVKITDRASQSLNKYFQEIGGDDLLTADEEVDLARRIREGDTKAFEKLVRSNLRFVVSVAKQYQNGTMSLGDLISEGNVGLIKAATRFDETRGFKFISYAVWWIRQAIIQALAERSRVVRLPINRISLLIKISKTSAELEQKLERTPSAEELAQALDLPVEEVNLNMRIAGKHISVDAPLGAEEGTGLLDILKDKTVEEPDSELMMGSLREDIQRALSTLTQRESGVISCYYGLGGIRAMKLEEIGQKFGLTPERVRQIKDKATISLRHSSRSAHLKSYLG